MTQTWYLPSRNLQQKNSPSVQVPHILVETADCTAIIMLQDLICEYHKGIKTFKVKI